MFNTETHYFHIEKKNVKKWPLTPALSSYARMRMMEKQLFGAMDPRGQLDVNDSHLPKKLVLFASTEAL